MPRVVGDLGGARQYKQVVGHDVPFVIVGHRKAVGQVERDGCRLRDGAVFDRHGNAERETLDVLIETNERQRVGVVTFVCIRQKYPVARFAGSQRDDVGRNVGRFIRPGMPGKHLMYGKGDRFISVITELIIICISLPRFPFTDGDGPEVGILRQCRARRNALTHITVDEHVVGRQRIRGILRKIRTVGGIIIVAHPVGPEFIRFSVFGHPIRQNGHRLRRGKAAEIEKSSDRSVVVKERYAADFMSVQRGLVEIRCGQQLPDRQRKRRFPSGKTHVSPLQNGKGDFRRGKHRLVTAAQFGARGTRFVLVPVVSVVDGNDIAPCFGRNECFLLRRACSNRKRQPEQEKSRCKQLFELVHLLLLLIIFYDVPLPVRRSPAASRSPASKSGTISSFGTENIVH